jgi:hypothetical protein
MTLQDYSEAIKISGRLRSGSEALGFNRSMRDEFLLQQLLIARINTGDFKGAQDDWVSYEGRFDPPEYLRALSAYAVAQYFSSEQ